ncbi:hypothetical protein FRC10_007408, partial [Ceratobasidium sp. 414]
EALAESHWDVLHEKEKRWPPFLATYGQEQSVAFGALLEEARKDLRSSEGHIDWSNDTVVLTSRGVFDRFAAQFDGSTAESGRWIAASLRVYARLPLWIRGRHEASFYPAAALPSTSWISAKTNEANAQQTATGSESTMALELLLDRWQVPWTQGTKAGNAVNQANWYRRIRGLHQVLMLCWKTRGLGSRDGRLMTAIEILDDPKLSVALCALRAPFDSLYRSLSDRCGANKSGRANYGIVPTLVTRNSARTGGEAKTQALLAKAKAALSDWVYKGGETELGDVLAAHPVLSLISSGYWEQTDVRLWCEGWNDQPSKQRATVGAAIGWGFLSDELLYQVVQPVLDSPSPARWLLHVARELMDIRGLQPWWPESQFSYSMPSPAVLPADPLPAPAALDPLPPPAAPDLVPPPVPFPPPAHEPLQAAHADKPAASKAATTSNAPPQASTRIEGAGPVARGSSPWSSSPDPAPAPPDSSK